MGTPPGTREPQRNIDTTLCVLKPCGPRVCCSPAIQLPMRPSSGPSVVIVKATGEALRTRRCSCSGAGAMTGDLSRGSRYSPGYRSLLPLSPRPLSMSCADRESKLLYTGLYMFVIVVAPKLSRKMALPEVKDREVRAAAICPNSTGAVRSQRSYAAPIRSLKHRA